MSSNVGDQTSGIAGTSSQATNGQIMMDPEIEGHVINMEDGDGHVTAIEMGTADAPYINYDEYEIIESGIVTEVVVDDDLPHPSAEIMMPGAGGSMVLAEGDIGETSPISSDAPGMDKLSTEDLPPSMDAPGEETVHTEVIPESVHAPGQDTYIIEEVSNPGASVGLGASGMEEDAYLVISEAQPVDQMVVPEPELVAPQMVVIEPEPPVAEELVLTEVEISDDRPGTSMENTEEEPYTSGYTTPDLPPKMYTPDEIDNPDGMNGHVEAMRVVEEKSTNPEEPMVGSLDPEFAHAHATRVTSITGYDHPNTGYAVATSPQPMSDQYEMQPISPQTVVVYSQPGPLPSNKMIDMEENEEWFKLKSVTNMDGFFAFACISFIINIIIGSFALRLVQKGRDAETPREGKKYGCFAILVGLLGICVTVGIVLLLYFFRANLGY